MIAVALCGCIAMLFNDGDIADNGGSVYRYAYLATFMISIPGAILYYIRPAYNTSKRLFRLVWMLFMWIALITILYNKSNLNGLIFNLTNVLMPLSIMHCTYYFVQKYGYKKESIAFTAFVMMLLLLIQYLGIYNISESHLISSYYPLFLLPLVLLHPSKIIRYSSIILVTVAIFSSLKRGGLIALVAGLIIYLICYRRVGSQKKGIFIYTILALCVLGGIFYYLASTEYTEIIERLMNIQEDEGSGRTDVWATTWQMISDSEFFPYILGHGNNAVWNDSPLDLSAHNDFLEAWYDFGFIGFAFYVLMLLSLLRYTIQLIRNKSSYAPSMAMLLTITLILTMISHVLIYYFINFVCLTIAITSGYIDNNERNE
ncbi:MAG: O-antigen ligase family protein [Paludibacteraceae bacterium]|nr:O-antigen ligase family protein [Paludibacteraceae bacterium]